jgi:hypothetical protein
MIGALPQGAANAGGSKRKFWLTKKRPGGLRARRAAVLITSI